MKAIKGEVRNWIMSMKEHGINLNIDANHRNGPKSLMKRLIRNDPELRAFFGILYAISGFIVFVSTVTLLNVTVTLVTVTVTATLALMMWHFWIRLTNRFGYNIICWVRQ